jgi:hypothetical protein
MNQWDKIRAYKDESAVVAAKIKALEAITDRWNRPKEATLEEITRAGEELRVLKLVKKIRHDNLRRLVYEAALPVLLEILNRWNGKPYGEKTKAKINAEMKERTGIAAYLSGGYGEDVTLVPLNAEGYSDYQFSPKDFDIYTRWRDGERPRVLEGNRINGALTMDDFYLSDGREFVENPEARAVEILEGFSDLLKKVEALEVEVRRFNDLLPSGVEHREIPRIKNYL